MELTHLISHQLIKVFLSNKASTHKPNDLVLTSTFGDAASPHGDKRRTHLINLTEEDTSTESCEQEPNNACSNKQYRPFVVLSDFCDILKSKYGEKETSLNKNQQAKLRTVISNRILAK